MRNSTRLKQTLQHEQVGRIKELEKEVMVMRGHHSDTIQQLKSRFLREKRDFQQDSDAKISSMSKQANKVCNWILVYEDNVGNMFAGSCAVLEWAYAEDQVGESAAETPVAAAHPQDESSSWTQQTPGRSEETTPSGGTVLGGFEAFKKRTPTPSFQVIWNAGRWKERRRGKVVKWLCDWIISVIFRCDKIIIVVGLLGLK